MSTEFHTVRAVWTDLNGVLRGAAIPGDRFERVRETGIASASAEIELSFDRTIPEASKYGPEHGNVVAVPDTDPPTPLEWRDGVGMSFCTLEDPDGSAFDLCSRSALRRVRDAFETEGYDVNVGVEIEFSLLERSDDGSYVPFNDRSSNAIDGVEDATEQIREWIEAMEVAGYEVLAVHQEGQPGQYEVNLGHDDPVTIADGVVLFKHVIKSISRTHGLAATLMPRPHEGEEANGLHVHTSLVTTDSSENAFAGGSSDPLELSETARHFVGGNLAHAEPLTAICAPTVNSYKRLVPGLWAPVNVAWGPDNRSTVVRIPPERGPATRIEQRVPDTSCNPYLAIAGTLAAGLDGLRERTDPGEPTTENAYHQDFDRLPRTLWGALDHLEECDVLRDALGEDLVAEFITVKRDEFDRYQNAVTSWERDEYLDLV